MALNPRDPVAAAGVPGGMPIRITLPDGEELVFRGALAATAAQEARRAGLRVELADASTEPSAESLIDGPGLVPWTPDTPYQQPEPLPDVRGDLRDTVDSALNPAGEINPGRVQPHYGGALAADPGALSWHPGMNEGVSDADMVGPPPDLYSHYGVDQPDDRVPWGQPTRPPTDTNTTGLPAVPESAVLGALGIPEPSATPALNNGAQPVSMGGSPALPPGAPAAAAPGGVQTTGAAASPFDPSALFTDLVSQIEPPEGSGITTEDIPELVLRLGLSMANNSTRPGASAVSALAAGGSETLDYAENLDARRQASAERQYDRSMELAGRVTDLAVQGETLRQSAASDAEVANHNRVMEGYRERITRLAEQAGARAGSGSSGRSADQRAMDEDWTQYVTMRSGQEAENVDPNTRLSMDDIYAEASRVFPGASQSSNLLRAEVLDVADQAIEAIQSGQEIPPEAMDILLDTINRGNQDPSVAPTVERLLQVLAGEEDE